MARKQQDNEQDKYVFVTDDGREIRLRKADAFFIQSVQRSVTMPKKPTYETKTAGGRVEVRPMDKLAAEQTEGGLELWRQYEQDYAEATTTLMERSTRAVLLDGTVRPDGEFITDKWRARMRAVNVPLAEDEDELWLQYLIFSLTGEEILRISGKIMRLLGVAEEVIAEAEETFHSPVHAEQG